MSKIQAHDKLNEHRLDICKAFNDNPREGIAAIKFICETNELDSPKQIAAFFLDNRDNLDLEAIGDYLGTAREEKKSKKKTTEEIAEEAVVGLDEPLLAKETEEENKAVLAQLVQQMDFKGKTFTEALRDYLKAFRLPGEGQKIERLLAAFGSGFVMQNPGVISPESIDILSNATIMAHTSAHNPSVKEKDRMTLSGFKSILRGQNDKKDFEPDFLHDIYQDVSQNKFELNFNKTPPVLELKSDQLANDPTFKTLSNLDKSTNVKLYGSNTQLNITTPEPKKPWYSRLFTGQKRTLTIDNQDQGKVNIEISEPSIFGRIFGGKKPEVAIKPFAEKGKEPRAVDIEMAAKVASMFSSDVASSKATYAYQKHEMAAAYEAAEQKQKRTNGLVRTLDGIKTTSLDAPARPPATPPAPQLDFPDLGQAPDIFGLQPQEAVAPKPRVTELPPVPIAVPIPKAKGPAPIAVPIPDEMDVAKPKVHKRRASFAEETKAQKAEAKPRRNSI
jgi:guanine nucleotide exchange protein RalF